MTIDETIVKLDLLRKKHLNKIELYNAEKFVHILNEIPSFNFKKEEISCIEKELSILFVKDEIDPKTIKLKLKNFIEFLEQKFSITKQNQNLIYTSLAGGLIGVFFGFTYFFVGLIVGSLIGYLLDLNSINNNRTFKTKFNNLL